MTVSITKGLEEKVKPVSQSEKTEGQSKIKSQKTNQTEADKSTVSNWKGKTSAWVEWQSKIENEN